jgi:hypothetical protein
MFSVYKEFKNNTGIASDTVKSHVLSLRLLLRCKRLWARDWSAISGGTTS